MPLQQNLATWKAEHRANYVASLNLRESARADMLKAIQKSDAEHGQERAAHLKEMFANYTAQNFGDAHERVERIRREHLASDLKILGFVEHLLTHQESIITFLVHPNNLPHAGKTLRDILTANRNANLYEYEDQLEVFIIKIDRPQPTPGESSIYV